MTVVRLPDLRGSPPSSYLGWYALETSGVSVPALDDARACAKAELGPPDACELRVTRFDPVDGATFIALPADSTIHLSVELTPGAPPDTTAVLSVTDPNGTPFTELTGTASDGCRTKFSFSWIIPMVFDDGVYQLELSFRQEGEPDVVPAGSKSEVVFALGSMPAASLPVDSCAITLEATTQMVGPALDPPVAIPRPPVVTVAPNGCEVHGWSAHQRGLIVAPSGETALDVFASVCGGLAFQLDFASETVRDAIFWGDRLAVLLADRVELFDLRGCPLHAFVTVSSGVALGIDDTGNLVVIEKPSSTPAGVVRTFRPDGSELLSPGAFDARGWYARHRNPAFVYDAKHCAYLLDAARVAVTCCSTAVRELSDEESLFFRTIDDLRTLRTRPAFLRHGTVIVGPNLEQQPLDSGRPATHWHRALLFGEIPAGCVVQVQTRASDDLLGMNPLLPDGWSEAVDATPASAVPVASPNDLRQAAADVMVLSEPGRYLELKLTLRGDGNSTPRITGIELERPRAGIARFLPEVFRDSTPEDDFLRRWLALFEQTAFNGISQRLDAYAELFDPGTTREDMLEYLAGWLEILSLDRFKSDPGAFRRVLRAAPELARTRGTPSGLVLAVRLYMGISIHVVESFSVGSNFVVACDPDASEGAVLGCGTILSSEQAPTYLGDEPRLGESYLLDCDDRTGTVAHHFDILVPGHAVCTSADRALLAYIIEVEKPAHTSYHIRVTGSAGWVVGRSILGDETNADFDLESLDPASYGLALLNGPPRPKPLGEGFTLGRDSRLAARTGASVFRLDEPGATVGRTTRIGA